MMSDTDEHTPLQPYTNGDVEMVNGQADQATEPASDVNHDFLETPASPSAPTPQSTMDISNPSATIPLPESILPGTTEPVPSPAPVPQALDLPSAETMLDTTVRTATAPSSASVFAPTASPSKGQSPAPSLSGANLFGSSGGGVASPARSSTPVPGAANNLPPSAIIPPVNANGSPTRVYMNTKITPVLLEGLKWVARNEPDKPLKWLGEYLLKRSADVEGT